MSDIITKNLFPTFLFKRLSEDYGKETAEEIARGSYGRAVTLRANALKSDRQLVKAALTEAGIRTLDVPWYGDALILPDVRENAVRNLKIYSEGHIYLQSLSSMLPPLFLSPKAGENILDMTAAPGGKTAQLLALSGGAAQITACEKDKLRFERMKHNLALQGAGRVNCLCTDALKLSDFLRFDKILLDAPCSGSGTLDLRAPLSISEKLIDNCAKLQEQLLIKALKMLKSGGELVYSTCSVLKCENENVLDRVFAKTGAELIPVAPFPGLPLLPSAEGTVCLRPTELYEGFFVAKIKKR